MTEMLKNSPILLYSLQILISNPYCELTCDELSEVRFSAIQHDFPGKENEVLWEL